MKKKELKRQIDRLEERIEMLEEQLDNIADEVFWSEDDEQDKN